MNDHTSQGTMITSFDEAAELIGQLGILPLASLIPDYPSLESVTPRANWHSDTEQDPWRWRVRFPAEGKAAYGKFMKKKAVLVSPEWFPLVYHALRLGQNAETCFKDGLLSRTAWELYQLIEIEQGIDTRVLRERAFMKGKEDKKAFDQAVIELQDAMFIVISGVKAKVNAAGEKNGWSSTSYETAANWMRQNGIKESSLSKQDARSELMRRLRERCSGKTLAYFEKIFQC
ncbi:hypothetical protein RJP21_16840 [Paenibacillus sp. VCA1]|uniref:AlkZ-related protein n=1 Tax=Paenibacillus sp. VCA1 TaxID=3039148 RepID=UPI002870FE6A|nr:hypothetical protein [Paenibacillus sp. VCA1]MDR9855285.1 hypothetical protein [Paenibacillus sp. VCA1]